MLSTILLLFISLMLCIIFIYVKLKNRKLIKSVTSFSRGEKSERKLVLKLLKFGINPKAIFHDLYIRKPSGNYTQVDVVVATKVGIIVFEVKDYSGWIFGNEYQRYWTQLLAFGKEKHRFYNPIMQNDGHVKAIRQCLHQNVGIPIYSVVVFFGKCKLKKISYNANNTFVIRSRSVRKILNKILNQPTANFGNKYEIMELFTTSVQNGNDWEIVSSQIELAKYYSRNKPRSVCANPFRSFVYFILSFIKRNLWK